MTSALTDAAYWIQSYRSEELVAYDLDNDHFDLLFRFVDPSVPRSALEIGSYPGPFLAALGQLGWELNGVDFHPENATRIPSWLRDRGCRVGLFESSDFFDFKPQRQFDLVYSLGFIEHFLNYPDVVRRHAELVAPGGVLLLGAPNFRGWIQHALHYLLDRPNLRRHHLPAMNPQHWAEVLREQGFDIRFAGPYGKIGFWVDPLDPRSRVNRAVARFVTRVFWNVKKVYRGDAMPFSTFCGLVAVRRDHS